MSPELVPSTDARAERRLAALAVLGMVLASVGTWVRFALDRTPVIDTSKSSFVIASAIAGVGILVAGIASLRLASRARALSFGVLARYVVLAQLAAVLGLALTSADVFTNLCFGQLSHAGLSPYVHSPAELPASPLRDAVPARWANDPAPYGPLFLPFVRVSAAIGELAGSPLWGSLVAFKLILLAALLAALALAAWHLLATRPAVAPEVLVVLGLGPLLAWEVSSQGHNDGLLVLAVVAFFVAAEKEREVVATIALAAGVAVKYALAPLLALYLVFVLRRSLLRAVALGVVALLVIALAFAPEARTVTLAAVLPMLGGEAGRHAHSFIDLVCSILNALGLTEASRIAFVALSWVSKLVCLALLARAALTARTLEGLARGYLLFLFGLYLTTPWFQPWYVAWALPVLVVERDGRWRRLIAEFAVITVAQWAAPLDPVTTVAGNVWLVVRLVRLLGAPAPAASDDASDAIAAAITSDDSPRKGC